MAPRLLARVVVLLLLLLLFGIYGASTSMYIFRDDLLFMPYESNHAPRFESSGIIVGKAIVIDSAK